MKNRRISIPASAGLSSHPYIGFYNARKTLPLKNAEGGSGCSCDFTEEFERIHSNFDEVFGVLSQISGDSQSIENVSTRLSELETLVEHIQDVIIIRPDEEDPSYDPPSPDDPSYDPPPPDYYDFAELVRNYNAMRTEMALLQSEYNELASKYQEEKEKEFASWDPFALSDETDQWGQKPHTREYLSGYLVDLSSDFTMADMENSFYGMQGMLNACYFNSYGKAVPSIPYDEEVTATHEVSTYILTTQNVVNEQGLSSYDYNIGDLWAYRIGSTIDISERSNPLSGGSRSGGIDGKMWHDDPPPDSQCWSFLSTHIVEEKQSIGPTFDHLRKTYNAIVSAFVETQSNFGILFEKHNVRMLEQEESTMDVLQAAMNNLIYTLLGTYNSHTDILYQNLAQFVEQTNPDNPDGDYSLNTVAKAVRELAMFLQSNF